MTYLDDVRQKRRERMVMLYRCGYTLKEVAQEMGCGLTTVHDVLKAAGIPRRAKGRQPEDISDSEVMTLPTR